MAGWLRLALVFVAIPFVSSAVEYSSTNFLQEVSEASLREAIEQAQTSNVPTKITSESAAVISLQQPLVLEGAVWIDLPGTVFTGGGEAGAIVTTSNANARLSSVTVSNVIARTNAPVLNEGTLLIENCVLEQNGSLIGYGGAIHNRGDLTVRETSIRRNSSKGEWRFYYEPARGSITGAGGGIHQAAGTLQVFDTVIESNHTEYGVIASNIPTEEHGYGSAVGGGIYVGGGTVALVRTTISDNDGHHGASQFRGAGIYISGGELFATNCTILRNKATAADARTTMPLGGQVPAISAVGGGVYVNDGKAEFVHCTVAENSSIGGRGNYSADGIGFGAGLYVAGGEVNLRGCIVLGNIGDRGRDVWGGFVNAGGNVIGAINDESPSLETSEGISLPPLRSPQGLWYYSLPPGSPARDANVDGLSDDILSRVRPIGDFYDAGSFEADAVLPTILSEIPERIILTPGSTELLMIEAEGTRIITYELLRGEEVISSGTNSVFTFSGEEAVGVYRIRLSNVAGVKLSEAFEVFYRKRLTFVEQPASQQVAPRGTATFRVALTGEGPMSFQWFKGEVAIAGATKALLEVTNVQSVDLGAYHVRVMNATEAVDSFTVSLSFWPVLFVSNLNETGFGSLRAAIEEANLTPEADLRTIEVRAIGTVPLGRELLIRSRVQLQGTGLTISGRGTTRVLRIETNGLARISNFTFVDGRAAPGERGGAILNEGQLELTDCTLTNNEAAYGGAIYNLGSMALSRSVFSNNTALGQDGQNGNGPGGGGAGMGGAIYSASGAIYISNVVIRANLAKGGDGGAFVTNGVPVRGGNEPPTLVWTNGMSTNDLPLGVGGGGGFRTTYILPGRPPITAYRFNPGHPATLGGGGGGGVGGGLCVFCPGPYYIGYGSAPGFGGGGSGEGAGAGGGGGLGGALFVEDGTVHIIDSEIVSNEAMGGLGLTNGIGVGGAVFAHGGTVSVEESAVRENRADQSKDFYGNVRISGSGFLSIAVENGVIWMRWPTNLHNYVLEAVREVHNLEWKEQSIYPSVEGGLYEYSRAPSGTSGFFRLRPEE